MGDRRLTANDVMTGALILAQGLLFYVLSGMQTDIRELRNFVMERAGNSTAAVARAGQGG